MSWVRRIDWLLLYPLLCPAVLVMANNDGFGFDPPGWLDSFVYLGYFWHYPEHLWVFDDNSNYKISRLPWVLPGVAAHALLSPVAAARVLAYASLASAAVAVYLHVRDALQDRYAAAFAGVLLACCTGMHAPGGWYYHALPAAGYYLWSCWLVGRAAKARPSRVSWAAAAGACFAAAVHTHIFLAVFAPLLLLLYWGAVDVDGEPRWPRWRTATISATAGALGLTAILAVVNRVTGGEWLFFLPQLEIAFKLSQHDRWWLPAEQWLPHATYLVLPIALIATGLSSWSRQWKTQDRLKATLIALPCVALVVACVFQFWTRETTLDYDYMAFVLYLHAFAAAAIAVTGRADSNWRRATLLAGATVLALAPLIVFMPSGLPTLMSQVVERLGLGHFPRIVPPLLFSLAGVAIASATPRGVRLVVVAVWFSLVNAWIAPQPEAYGFRTGGPRQAMLETFREADLFTHRLDPTLIGIKYWMSNEDLPTLQGPLPSQQVFDSFLATRAWLTNLFARASPGLPIDTLTREHLDNARCLGILSSRERQAALAQAMVRHYAALDRPLVVVAERRFQRGDFAFAMTVLARREGTTATDPQPCSSKRVGGA